MSEAHSSLQLSYSQESLATVHSRYLHLTQTTSYCFSLDSTQTGWRVWVDEEESRSGRRRKNSIPFHIETSIWLVSCFNLISYPFVPRARCNKDWRAGDLFNFSFWTWFWNSISAWFCVRFNGEYFIVGNLFC